MARKCDLMIKGKRLKGSKIAEERSRVTKRTNRFFEPNLQKKKFKTPNIQKRFKLQNRTLRTIEKYGGIEEFLLNIKKAQLTDFGKKLRSKLLKKGLKTFNKIEK